MSHKIRDFLAITVIIVWLTVMIYDSISYRGLTFNEWFPSTILAGTIAFSMYWLLRHLILEA